MALSHYPIQKRFTLFLHAFKKKLPVVTYYRDNQRKVTMVITEKLTELKR